MKKHRRVALIVAQIFTLGEALFLAVGFFLLVMLALGFGSDFFVVREALLYGFFCVLIIPFAISGILHAYKAPQGYYKLGSAIISIVFNGLLLLILAVFIFIQDNLGFIMIFIELILGFIVASEYLLIYGLSVASKEKRASLSEIPPQDAFQSSDSSPEKAAWTNALCALWKLYEQHLITEEEYTEKKQEIYDRGFSTKSN